MNLDRVTTLQYFEREEPAISDIVVGLRLWAGDTLYNLPRPPGRQISIGSSRGCDIHLNDPHRFVSRRHAQLRWDISHWVIEDDQSKNGVYVDDVERSSSPLLAGMRIRVGGMTLVAESTKSIDLRSYLARILGWGEYLEIDKILQEIRIARQHRQPIILKGDEDLVEIARDLHKRISPAGSPFIMCDPHRSRAEGDARSARNIKSFEKAVLAAENGTVCLRGARMPYHFSTVWNRLQRQALGSPLLMICGTPQATQATQTIRSRSTIIIPPLSTRSRPGAPDQIDHIITEFFADAAGELGLPRGPSPEDRRWIRHHAKSLTDIAKASRRLLALQEGSVKQAAALLGLSPVSLRRWLARRSMPASS